MLFAALARLRRLAKVDFSENLIADAGMVAVAGEIAGTRRPPFTSLRFNGNKVANEGAVALFMALKAENSVSEVGLAENALKEDFAAWLDAWLRTQRARDVNHSHELVKIHLGGNSLSLEGYRAVAAQVSVNQRFQVERTTRAIAQDVALKKAASLSIKRTLKKQKRCAKELIEMDEGLQEAQGAFQQRQLAAEKALEERKEALDRL